MKSLWKVWVFTFSYMEMLGLVPLNPIVWCCIWHYVWLNVVINKIVLLLSKIMVTWIFGHYHKIHKMHSMWFMWFSHRKYKSQVLCKLGILVQSRWWNWAFHLRRLHNISTKMICLDHGSWDFYLICWYVLRVKTYWTGPLWDLLFS